MLYWRSIQFQKMNTKRPFALQLVIISGFIAFFYIFFALTTSIYKDYRLEKHIQEFENNIDVLVQKAYQKPKDVEYFGSVQYKDRYAKESLNLLNPGEKLIVIPQGDQNIVRGNPSFFSERKTPAAVLTLANRNQWWEYFFGQTLSVTAPSVPKVETPSSPPSQDSPEVPQESDEVIKTQS
ncbi:hypothetical protein COY07_06520 [Candidatus Peregrinibacteria bacterium CG_4_10_14_0_2_um_filter_43_11]|nr:MAG: hypothetical protein COY07_06520 [Candidatus Peregrinibacteria bacterium CG_4_10_14_0_2_um_filter_43_11]